MNPFRKINVLRRRKAVDAGIVAAVTARTGRSRSTVSRTFAGRIKTPDQAIVEALWEQLERIEVKPNAGK